MSILSHVSPPVEPDAPGEPRLPMPDWIEVQASLIRLNGSNLADWLANRIDELASECRFLQATTPDEFEARAEVMADLVVGHATMAQGGAR